MSLSILQNLKLYQTDPYPYAVVAPALPDETYAELVKTRPAIEDILGGRRPGNNLRFDMDAKILLTWDEAPLFWKKFVEYHTSTAFWLEVVKKSGDAIREVYPSLERNVGKRLEDFEVGVRFVDKNKDIYLDCKPGVNTRVRERSRVRGPHLDNPHELWAGLLYMRHPHDKTEGGDFVVNRLTKEPEFYGKAEIYDECCVDEATVKYAANTFACFVNGPNAVHSVTTRDPTPHARLLANFCAELDFPLFQIPKRRAKRWPSK